VEGTWPNGTTTDPAAWIAQTLARRLAEATEGMSLRAVEAMTGVDHSTISKVLTGQSWPDVATVGYLEAGVGADLWPRRSEAKRATPADRLG
jgi:transcriptional regulator with XRE-family HTH domain